MTPVPLADRVMALLADDDTPHASLEECCKNGCENRFWCADVRKRHTELLAIAAELERVEGVLRDAATQPPGALYDACLSAADTLARAK